jgi:hypothetical protein
VFRYERREGTPAARNLRGEELPEDLAQRRYDLLVAELPDHMALGKPSWTKTLCTKFQKACIRVLDWYEGKTANPTRRAEHTPAQDVPPGEAATDDTNRRQPAEQSAPARSAESKAKTEEPSTVGKK